MPKPLAELKPATLRRKLRQAQQELVKLTATWRQANVARCYVEVKNIEAVIRAGTESQQALNAMRRCYAWVRQLETALNLPPAEPPAPRHYYE